MPRRYSPSRVSDSVFICLDIIDGAAGCVSESEFEDEDNKVLLPEEKSSNLYILKRKIQYIFAHQKYLFFDYTIFI